MIALLRRICHALSDERLATVIPNRRCEESAFGPRLALAFVLTVLLTVSKTSEPNAATRDVSPPARYGAIPSPRQLKWHEMETYAFLHFSPNTFTDKEWGYGDENPSIFNPTDFDADQIVKALKAGGMKGVILTCKHHDGFCLWPTKTTTHNISASPWHNGKGDVVKEISSACRRHGLKFGVYLSPWDRNNPKYATPEYIQIYRQQLRELLTWYGPIYEVWHDGANGGDGFYGGAREKRSIDSRTYYQWPETWKMVRQLQPNAVIFSDVGPDIRWIGNESGYANETSWATYDPVGGDGGPPAPGYTRYREAPTGHRNGSKWLPGECDVSIRPGWFWHEAENGRVKTPRQLMDLYYKSVGRGASFLLNVPPDRRGRLHENDVASLAGFGRLLRDTFKTNLASNAKLEASNIRGNESTFATKNLLDNDRHSYWATDDDVTNPILVVDLGKDTTFNIVRLRENTMRGQRIEGLALDLWKGGGWSEFATGTSVGNCRLIRTKENITTTKVRLRVTKSPVCIALSDFGLFLEAQNTTTAQANAIARPEMNVARHFNVGNTTTPHVRSSQNPANQLAGYHPFRTMKDDSALKLWFTKPATSFLESCPVGNGRLGAMMFGGVDKERIVLNEQTMWSGSKQDADRPDAHKVLPEIRRLLLAGENRQAQQLLEKNFLCKGPGSSPGKNGQYGSYETLGDLTLTFPNSKGEVKNYRRELDLDTATARVSYERDGVKYTREMFASAPKQVIVLRLTASEPGMLNFGAKLERKERAACSFDRNALVMSGQLNNGMDGNGVRYQARLAVRLDSSGEISNSGDARAGIQIRNAQSAVLLIGAGTDMFDKNVEATVSGCLDKAKRTEYTDLHKAQVADHRKYFRRVSLVLPATPNTQHPTPDRVAAMNRGEDDPALSALYFQFGRYLLICSSRPDSPLPANLQGLWAEEYQVPWNGDYHLNINVQMNYWPAEVANLSDCHRPLMRFVQSLVEPGRKTAKAYYDAPGWVAHVISNPWGFTSPGEGAGWGSTVNGGAWLCEHLWNHYAFTDDRKYLEWAYPILMESALFYQSILIEEPKHRWLVTAPSNSPENAYRTASGEVLNTCMGPTMDQEIVRELFTNVISASEILNKDPDLRARLKTTVNRLAPCQIGKIGQLQEWLEDYDEPEIHHRHVSHLYGLYPADQINPVKTPELARAAKVTLERRGDASTGWSMAWKVCFWSRLLDGDHANTLLKMLIGRGAPNLFCLHPPFQIDGNFGGCAGIAEMLLQSQNGELHLLPALPKSWDHGSVKGLKARGGYTVDIDWKDSRVTGYHVYSASRKRVSVRVDGIVRSVVSESRKGSL